MEFITTVDLAQLADISRQAARKAVVAGCWRGHSLKVRTRRGARGGGDGGCIYEVRVDSLPPDLQERFRAREAALRGPLKDDQAARVEREWRARLIGPGLAHPRHSEERAAAIRAVVAAPERHPIRGSVPVSERTLQRWIEQHELLGLGGLQRRQRKDVGTDKVFVSARWDRAVPFDDAVKSEFRGQVRQDLRNLWGRGATYSVVRRLASETLASTTRARGFDPGPEALAQICLLPKSIVETERDARRVHQYQTDRKAWNDTRGRVERSPNGLKPMQLVMADVHHIDVLVERSDGSTATPKLVAWMDVATHRIRGDLVLCEPGTSVRNADLIESFVEMALDPEWGMPSGLYVDNGSEFRFADFLADAMHLAGLRIYARGEGGPVKRSTPYEGASKGLLEGSFRNLQQAVFSCLPGYIAGQRMQSKSGNLGRPQKPFPGGFDAFAPIVRNGLAYHNTNERRGALRGRTPDQVFRAWVDRGWQRIDADVDELTMAFSVDDTRKVRQGKITVSLPGDPRGSVSYANDMLGRFEGQTVRVRLPKFQRWPGIPVYALTGDMKGQRIGVAMPETTYGYLDPAGAVEAGRRKRLDHAGMRELARTVQPTDVPARMAASAERRRGGEVPESGGIVQLRDGSAEDAADMRQRPPAEIVDEHEARRKRVKRDRAEQLKILSAYGGPRP